MPPMLTALFLLIAVATALLACGPVEQTNPEIWDTLPPAQDADKAGSTDNSQRSDANPDPHPDRPPFPPIPTRRYSKLTHNLDKKAIEAEAGQGAGGQSDDPAKIHVVIWMANNPDHATTKALIQWLEARSITPTSVSKLAEGYGDGTTIRAFVPAIILGDITRQNGVEGIRGTAHEQAAPVPLPGQPFP